MAAKVLLYKPKEQQRTCGLYWALQQDLQFKEWQVQRISPTEGFSAVTSTRVGLSGTTAPVKTPSCVLLNNSLNSAWVFVWLGFFLEQISMWKLRREMQVSPRARCDAPQPLSWGSQSHCFPLPSNFLWYWRTICAELSHNKKQLAQLNPLSPWIIVIVELLLKPVY